MNAVAVSMLLASGLLGANGAAGDVPENAKNSVVVWLKGLQAKQLRGAQARVKAAKQTLAAKGYTKEATAALKKAEDSLKEVQGRKEPSLEGDMGVVTADGKPFTAGCPTRTKITKFGDGEVTALLTFTYAIPGYIPPKTVVDERGGGYTYSIVYKGSVPATAVELDLNGEILYVVPPSKPGELPVFVPITIKPEDLAK